MEKIPNNKVASRVDAESDHDPKKWLQTPDLEKNQLQKLEKRSTIATQIDSLFRSEPFMSSIENVLADLDSSAETGLREEEALGRLNKYGLNQIDSIKPDSAFTILMRQLLNAMMLVLLAAMIVVFAIQDWIVGCVIIIVILINVVVGFWQERKAQKHMNSLQSLSTPTARVMRGGIVKEIQAEKLVPGDIVVLYMGDTIPADVRLISGVSLETDEALLIGESEPVIKDPTAIFDSAEIPLGDRVNMAYSSSNVTKGRGRGVVIYTGMYTQIGAIVGSMRGNELPHWKKPKERADGSIPLWAWPWAVIRSLGSVMGSFLGITVGTPLHRKLGSLAILLFICALICAFIVFAANKFSSQHAVVIYSVGTAISIVPASLLAVLTITMAAGTKQMLKRNVIVRKMDSLEALGAVTDICSDKTGTLTQGKMIVQKAWIPGHSVISVAQNSDPYNPNISGIAMEKDDGTQQILKKPHSLFEEQNEDAEKLVDNELEELLRIASMANIARLKFLEKEQRWMAYGDPTECALQVFVSKLKRPRQFYLDQGWKEILEYPFDSEVKRMSVIYKDSDGHLLAYMKGAVEKVICACSHFINGSEILEMTQDHQNAIFENTKIIASQGLRCLAFASKGLDISFEDTDPPPRVQIECNMILRGLIGIFDPPRPESAQAVQDAKSAGIAVHMLTGDHKETAESIAKEVGIIPRDTSTMEEDIYSNLVMTATEFDKMQEFELDKLKFLPAVIARCSPQTKVRMIDALHRRQRFVAMTGDGVNDSPALKRADVGIAMGKGGSDVAKDASDIVLTDDNFASIISAVEEGRRMFDNIQKFILHLLATNLSLVLYLLVGLGFKDYTGISVFPISPIELLWIIMVTACFPAMGLGFEKAAPNIMRRPPHNIKKGVFTNEIIIDMFFYGILIALLPFVILVILLLGIHNGDFGYECNDQYSSACMWVFKTRSTGFSLITIMFLLLPWVLIDFRKSTFYRKDANYHGNKIFEIFFTIWRNQFMFWSIVCGFLTLFPVIYIPFVNRVVFKHSPITWEWIIVAIGVLIFIVFTEIYKWIKRILIKKYYLKAHTNEDEKPMGF